MWRIRDKDLELDEKIVNELLKNIQLKVSGRYNYTAIDIVDKKTNHVMDTLLAGLTKKQAHEILRAIERILELERS
jgi:hypothetical protein